MENKSMSILVADMYWKLVNNKKTVQEALEILEQTKQEILKCQIGNYELVK